MDIDFHRFAELRLRSGHASHPSAPCSLHHTASPTSAGMGPLRRRVVAGKPITALVRAHNDRF